MSDEKSNFTAILLVICIIGLLISTFVLRPMTDECYKDICICNYGNATCSVNSDAYSIECGILTWNSKNPVNKIDCGYGGE